MRAGSPAEPPPCGARVFAVQGGYSTASLPRGGSQAPLESIPAEVLRPLVLDLEPS